MECINKVELRGTIGSVRTVTALEGTLIRFSVATNYAYKDKDGMAVIETTWHNCYVWSNKLNEGTSIEDFAKGATVHLLGRIRQVRYTDVNNQTVNTWEVVASSTEILK